MLRGDEADVITGRDERGDVGLRKKAAGLASAIALIALLVGSLFGDRGILHLMAQRERAVVLAREIASLRDENARLAGDIAALRSDPAAIERMRVKSSASRVPGDRVHIPRKPPVPPLIASRP